MSGDKALQNVCCLFWSVLELHNKDARLLACRLHCIVPVPQSGTAL